jgi:hypothetical protein
VGLAPNIFHPVPPNATAQDKNRALANRTDADYLADIRAGADYLRLRCASLARSPYDPVPSRVIRNLFRSAPTRKNEKESQRC